MTTSLKEQALIQRIGEIAMQDADNIANLRVQLTEALQELESLHKSITQGQEAAKEPNNVQ